jgi:hypothetical protein
MPFDGNASFLRHLRSKLDIIGNQPCTNTATHLGLPLGKSLLPKHPSISLSHLFRPPLIYLLPTSTTLTSPPDTTTPTWAVPTTYACPSLPPSSSSGSSTSNGLSGRGRCGSCPSSCSSSRVGVCGRGFTGARCVVVGGLGVAGRVLRVTRRERRDRWDVSGLVR